MATKERKYLNGEPLCLECEHQESMHHTWKFVPRIESFKDRLGVDNQRQVIDRLKEYDAQKPCQHACKCTEYK